MSLRTRRKRHNRGDGLTQVYPSQYAQRDVRRKAREELKRLEGYTSEAEPIQINCAQCNFGIEDHTAIDDCPFCGGTNFLGKPKWPQRR